VCVCVCARARAPACACVHACMHVGGGWSSFIQVGLKTTLQVMWWLAEMFKHPYRF
jgi:hypothetical protein